ALVCPVAFTRGYGIAGDPLKRCIGAEGTGKALGVDLSHVADAKRIEEAAQRDFAAGIDRVVELAHGNRAEALDLFKVAQRRLLALLKRGGGGRRADGKRRIVRVEEELDLLLAQAPDIESIARAKVSDALHRLR